MSHPAGAIRNYPFYPILPVSSLPFDLPPWRAPGPRDRSGNYTLVFRVAARVSVMEGARGCVGGSGGGGGRGTSCRVGIPCPRRHGYRGGWFILEGLPRGYSLCKIVKTNGDPRLRLAGKSTACGRRTFSHAFTQGLSLSRPPLFTSLKCLRQLMTGFFGGFLCFLLTRRSFLLSHSHPSLKLWRCLALVLTSDS